MAEVVYSGKLCIAEALFSAGFLSMATVFQPARAFSMTPTLGDKNGNWHKTKAPTLNSVKS